MRSCSDVHNYLLERGVAHEIVQLPAVSSTTRRAAALLGVPLHEVVKSLLLTTDRGLVLCLVPGDARVDHARLSAELGCRAAAPATAAEVVSLTGYRPSAMPPCGLAADLPIVADPAIFEPPVVYCGGGTTTTMLKIRSADLRDVLGARVAAIAVRPQNGAASRWAAG
ncbi:MAG: YbaK/EbsC family protein [Thermoleophilia bacterium]|jgi:Cys-tRNA(Pro)/Cys-tRNA(Cys) deacylase